MSKHKNSGRLRLKAERDRLELFNRLVAEATAADQTLTTVQALKVAEGNMPPVEHPNPHYPAKWLETAPSSLAVERKNVNSSVEIKAMFYEPPMAWLFDYLQDGNRGRPAERSLTAATLFHMANFGRPDAINTRRHFTGSGPTDWAYGNPEGPNADSAFYASIKKATKTHKSGAAIHVNLDLLDRIASLKDPKTGQLWHPNAFKHCVVDGTLIEADFPQRPVAGESPQARKRALRAMVGPDKEMVDYVTYGYETGSEAKDGPSPVGSVRKSVVGYNLVVVACMDLGLPVGWTLQPAAAGEERDGLMMLLKCIYDLRPEFPMEVIVGDGHFTIPHDMTGEIYLKYGVHTCFPRRKGDSTDNPWSGTDGVPECRHGLMQFEKEGEIWGAAKRRKHGLAPGTYPKQNRPRLRWRCRKGKCPSTETIMAQDWHLNTYLHHGGTHKRAALRAALLARRNIIESIFAQLKHLGPGSRWPGRARWADDDGMRWLLSLALVTMTAKRLAHESGAYYRAFEEARQLGHLSKRDLVKAPKAPEDGSGAEARVLSSPEPEAPSTWDPDYRTPIDEKYTLKPLLAYSATSDREDFARDIPPV